MPSLDWLNRDDAFRIAQRVPTRVLRPHPAGGAFGDAAGGNLLVQGDNLDASKALLPFYRGRVKCIFIDPPHNTRKGQVGRLWAGSSGGRCCFAMVFKLEDGMTMTQQIDAAPG